VRKWFDANYNKDNNRSSSSSSNSEQTLTHNSSDIGCEEHEGHTGDSSAREELLTVTNKYTAPRGLASYLRRAAKQLDQHADVTSGIQRLNVRDDSR
jgi:hypothetical protein